MNSVKKKFISVISVLAVIFSAVFVFPSNAAAKYQTTIPAFTYGVFSIPAYDGDPYEIVNNNDPEFTKSEMVTTPFEKYSDLDSLGRCGVAYANVCEETMPTEARGSISSVTPTAWHSVKYDIVSGKYLYNRSHLIGWQLTGENANKKNLITGTRSFNVDGMLPIENTVADYVEKTDHHVLYRVTPIFFDDNLLATGVLIEAESVEDDKINICVFAYNVQPGIALDYSDGDSCLEGGEHYDIDNCTAKLSATSVTYNGSYQKPTVTVKDGSKTLKNGTDYSLTYKNNKNAGKAAVVISGTGKYFGTKTVYFTIKPKSIAGLKYSKISNKEYTAKQIKPSLSVKDGSKTLVKNTNYTVTYSENKSIGYGYVKVKGKGDYTGSKSIKFTIIPQKVKDFKAATKKGALSLKWKKSPTVSGYQIQYRKMGTSKYKSITVKTTKKTLGKLSKKKYYQVKIRAYKKVDKKAIYGEFTKVIKIKTK